ncbi:MAG: beta-propeller fold lactonase family protein [Methylocystis sp.]
MIDTTTNKVVGAPIPLDDLGYTGGEHKVVGIAAHGKHVYLTHRRNNYVSVIDTVTKGVTATIPVGNEPNAVAVARDGKRAYVANCRDNSVSVIDTAKNAVVATVPLGASLSSIERFMGVSCPEVVFVAPDGKRVFVSGRRSDAVLMVIDAASNEVVATTRMGNAPRGIAVAPDGQHIFYASHRYNGGAVTVIDMASNTVAATVAVEFEPSASALAPDGKRIFVSGFRREDGVTIIDAANEKVVAKIELVAPPTASGVAPPTSTPPEERSRPKPVRRARHPAQPPP